MKEPSCSNLSFPKTHLYRSSQIDAPKRKKPSTEHLLAVLLEFVVKDRSEIRSGGALAGELEVRPLPPTIGKLFSESQVTRTSSNTTSVFSCQLFIPRAATQY